MMLKQFPQRAQQPDAAGEIASGVIFLSNGIVSIEIWQVLLLSLGKEAC